MTDDGTVLKCANIHWPVFNVKEKLFDLTGVANIRVGNDANVAALGEMWKGGGRGFDSIVMVTLGTGVGGGVARAGSIITESIEKYYNDSVMFALRGKQFNLAELGNDAGIYGAVRMVL